MSQGFLRLKPGGAALRFIEGVNKGFRGGSPFRRGRSPSERAPSSPRSRAVPEFPELQSRAQRLIAEIDAFAKENPNVEGISQMRKAAKGELRSIERVISGQVEGTPERAIGAQNNLSGIESELAAARSNPGVIGVNRKFSLDGRTNAIEVDVVADQGRTWIDRKRVEPFGLESSNWVGRPGKQGLRTQAQELLRSASQNLLPDGAVPRVVIDFPLGVSEEVAAALRRMGIKVSGQVIPLPPTPTSVRTPIIPSPPTDDEAHSEQ